MTGLNRLDNTELSDHEIFRQSITELDRIVASTWKMKAAEIAAVLAALASPFLAGNMGLRGQAPVVSIGNALLILVLIFLGYELVRHANTKSIRDRLARQLQVAVKQRIRADQLYGLSILDPLTGLHNRRFGQERLAEEIARSDRNGEPVAVLLIDLDYFKEINDQFGHAAGDAALKEFSRRLRRAIRACDVPVRIGGDEFLVILPECPREKVDAILTRMETPEIQFNSQTITIGYSVGRAHYQTCDTTETMLGRADESLYGAKAARPSAGHPAAKPTQMTSSATEGKVDAPISHRRRGHALSLNESIGSNLSYESYSREQLQSSIVERIRN